MTTNPEPDKDAEKSRLAILGQIKAFDLPPLEEGSDAYLSLEQSLLQHGCINPVVMDGQEVISGRARQAICRKHRIKYETIQVDDLSDVDVVSLRNDLTFVGRHINMATKKEYAGQLLLASKGELSNRAIQSKACLDKKLVQGIRDELEASGEIPHTTVRYSRDGRSQDITDKEERQGEVVESDPEDEGWQQDESNGEPGADFEESDNEDEAAGEEELNEPQDDKYPQLVCFDGPDPDELPKHVYEVNKEKLTIVRRKVDREEGEKYVVANGQLISKCYAHPTWAEAHYSLLTALQGDKEAAVYEIEELGDQRKELLAELKSVENHIARLEKGKQKLALRLTKVEAMSPPKRAEAEMEEAIA
jgi:hypothetical protein